MRRIVHHDILQREVCRPHARYISSLKFLAGFCYTQLTDIEQEVNGLLTYDHNPKLDPERIAELHRELFKGM